MKDSFLLIQIPFQHLVVELSTDKIAINNKGRCSHNRDLITDSHILHDPFSPYPLFHCHLKGPHIKTSLLQNLFNLFDDNAHIFPDNYLTFRGEEKVVDDPESFTTQNL